ncbi:MAG TPA: TetR/AcrR family transcriptional regulator [Candidatus Cybelea sp.]|nr:TetR/AcrR family transcriptional regulator [Candidatus Cybelea sp.]
MQRPRKAPKRNETPEPQEARRERICDAAFAVLMERGYAAASTLDIATRAKVSKRELYAQFGSKLGIFQAMISGRASRMRLALQSPSVRSREGLAQTLARFGIEVQRGIGSPGVIALYRLAVVEAEASPEMARELDACGRKANLAALAKLTSDMQSAGILRAGDPMVMARQFFWLLSGDTMMRSLMGVEPAPTSAEMQRRAQAATDAFMTLHVAE